MSDPIRVLTRHEDPPIGAGAAAAIGVALGLPNKRIASRLTRAVGTLKVHIQAVLARLEARRRTGSTAIAEQQDMFGLRSVLAA